jgi:hypothetical protein
VAYGDEPEEVVHAAALGREVAELLDQDQVELEEQAGDLFSELGQGFAQRRRGRERPTCWSPTKLASLVSRDIPVRRARKETRQPAGKLVGMDQIDARPSGRRNLARVGAT